MFPASIGKKVTLRYSGAPADTAGVRSLVRSMRTSSGFTSAVSKLHETVSSIEAPPAFLIESRTSTRYSVSRFMRPAGVNVTVRVSRLYPNDPATGFSGAPSGYTTIESASTDESSRFMSNVIRIGS